MTPTTTTLAQQHCCAEVTSQTSTHRLRCVYECEKTHGTQRVTVFAKVPVWQCCPTREAVPRAQIALCEGPAWADRVLTPDTPARARWGSRRGDGTAPPLYIYLGGSTSLSQQAHFFLAFCFAFLLFFFVDDTFLRTRSHFLTYYASTL